MIPPSYLVKGIHIDTVKGEVRTRTIRFNLRTLRRLIRAEVVVSETIYVGGRSFLVVRRGEHIGKVSASELLRGTCSSHPRQVAPAGG